MIDKEKKPKSFWPTAAAGVLGGVAGYAALRRFRPSKFKELAELQHAAKGKKFGIVLDGVEGQEKALGGLMGTKVFSPKNAPADRVLLHHGTDDLARKATKTDLNAGDVPYELGDKKTFPKMLERAGAPNATPKTRSLGEMKDTSHEGLQKELGKDFIVKDRMGSMTKADDLITEKTPRSDQRWKDAEKDKDNFIAQERVPIKREYRVHTLNNVPFSATHRRLPHKGVQRVWNKLVEKIQGDPGGGGSFLPVMGGERKKLTDFVRESTKGLPTGVHQAFDVAKLPDGSYKLIESNPFPGSIGNPVIARRLQRQAMGRWGKDVAVAGGAASGIAAAEAASKLQDRGHEKKAAPSHLLRGFTSEIIKLSFDAGGTQVVPGAQPSPSMKLPTTAPAQPAAKLMPQVLPKPKPTVPQPDLGPAVIPGQQTSAPSSKSEPLKYYQQRVVDRISRPDQPGLVVAHGLGTGKTRTSIEVQKALGMDAGVVVPAALRGNYDKEIQRWNPNSKNKTEVSSLQGAASSGKMPNEPLLIVDEAHRMRDPGSKTYQAVRTSPAKKRILLTASPFYNHPSDIAPLIDAAAGEEILPKDREGFTKRYVTTEEVKPGFFDRLRGVHPGERQVINPKGKKELTQVFKKWVDFHKGTQEDFPSVARVDVKVPMSKEQLRMYDAILGRAPSWVSRKIRAGLPPDKQEAKQLNAFLGAVRQVSNTTRPFQTKGTPSEPKIDAAFGEAQKTLNSNPRAKVVVYSNYLDAGINPYKERLKAAGIPFGEFVGGMKVSERNELVRKYNAGEIKVLLLSTAGGEGLDLKGTRAIQILDPHWNWEKIKQVEGRGIRYKSHAGLPPEEQNVVVQRFSSIRPRSGILESLHLRKPGHAVDEYLQQMSSDKERLIDQFRALLPKEEDQPKTASVRHRSLAFRPGVMLGFAVETVMNHEKTAVSEAWVRDKVIGSNASAPRLAKHVAKMEKATSNAFNESAANMIKQTRGSTPAIDPGYMNRQFKRRAAATTAMSKLDALEASRPASASMAHAPKGGAMKYMAGNLGKVLLGAGGAALLARLLIPKKDHEKTAVSDEWIAAKVKAGAGDKSFKDVAAFTRRMKANAGRARMDELERTRSALSGDFDGAKMYSHLADGDEAGRMADKFRKAESSAAEVGLKRLKNVRRLGVGGGALGLLGLTAILANGRKDGDTPKKWTVKHAAPTSGKLMSEIEEFSHLLRKKKPGSVPRGTPHGQVIGEGVKIPGKPFRKPVVYDASGRTYQDTVAARMRKETEDALTDGLKEAAARLLASGRFGRAA